VAAQDAQAQQAQMSQLMQMQQQQAAEEADRNDRNLQADRQLEWDKNVMKEQAKNEREAQKMPDQYRVR
jgi:hypothetical protein